ncbi:hypothetical protein R4391_30080 [Mycolicibacterium fortuitum]|nr:hypothetical protein [Mycolicibacterium fortuitum]MDV7194500.1 hypothetical protein [Mycolicibacterium fortuitum]
MRRSVELTKLSGELVATAQDGQVGAMRLLNYGSGDLADLMSGAWTKYFVNLALVGGQVAEAAACLEAWAATLGAMLAEMAAVVGWAESAISALEAMRPAEAITHIDVDAMIEQVKTEAKSQVAAISSAAMGALAAVPSWAGSVPAAMPMPGGAPAGGEVTTGPGQSPSSPAGGTPSEVTSGPGQSGTGAQAMGNASGATSGPGQGGELGNQGADPAGVTTGPGQPAITPAGFGQPGGGGSSTSGPGLSSGGGSSSIPGGGAPGSATAPNASAPSGAPAAASGGSTGGATGGSGVGADAAGAPAASSGSSPAATGGSAPAAAPVSHSSTAVPAAESSAAAPAAAAPGAGAFVGPAAAAAGPAAAAPVSAAPTVAAPIASASAAAGAVAPAPPVPPPSPVAPLSPGSAVPPPPPAVAPPAAAAGVPATAAPGPAPALHGPPPGPVPTAHTAAPSSTPVSNSSQQQNPDPSVPPSGGPASGGVAGPMIAPLSGGSDPLIVPAVLEPPASPVAAVGDQDLATVREVVEAAGGADAVHWAAGMVVTSGRRQVVLTSDRGRGWVPAEALLPADVVMPWSHEDSARWEGLLDPSRVIVEYAASVGGQLTALASTFASAPAVADGVPWVPVDGTDHAHPEMLSGPVVTRFELQVSEARRRAVKHIVDSVKQREQVLWLAFNADEKAGSSETRHKLLSMCRAHLGRIDNARWVASLPWEQLEEEHHQICVKERAARVDVRDIPIGHLDTEGGACRSLLAQAYATEAAMALRNPVALRALADATYSWSMLLDVQSSEPSSAPLQFAGR